MQHPLIESIKTQPSGSSRRNGLPPTLLLLILQRLESIRRESNGSLEQEGS